MKLTDKAKKRLTLAGLGVVCIVLVVAIAAQFRTQAPKDPEVDSSAPPTNTVAPSEIIPKTENEDDSQGSKPDVSVQPIDSTDTSPEQVGDTGDSSGTEQSIQAEVTNPPEPSEEAKTNPSQTPDGKPVTELESNTSSPPQTSAPESGDKNDQGQIYVPGFGWIEDNGGGGSGTTADDMYENGNKIGIMD